MCRCARAAAPLCCYVPLCRCVCCYVPLRRCAVRDAPLCFCVCRVPLCRVPVPLCRTQRAARTDALRPLKTKKK